MAAVGGAGRAVVHATHGTGSWIGHLASRLLWVGTEQQCIQGCALDGDSKSGPGCATAGRWGIVPLQRMSAHRYRVGGRRGLAERPNEEGERYAGGDRLGGAAVRCFG